MNGEAAGGWLVALGLLLVVIGLVLWSGAGSWFGHLPGDLRIERPRLSVEIPLTSMLLVSLGLTGLLWLVRRFF